VPVGRGVEDVGLAVQGFLGEDLHGHGALAQLPFECLQGGLAFGGGQASHELVAQVRDELVASGQGTFPVVDVGAVLRRLDLVLEQVEQLLGVGGGHHPDQDPRGGSIGRDGLGVEDVGQAGPAAQVDVAGGDVDGVEVVSEYRSAGPRRVVSVMLS
jgi:hypothetical protein